MEKSPLVSVIVPVYNSSKWIEKCVASILSQTYGNLEVLLINDGSTDTSGDKCLKLSAQDARIKYFRRENVGVSETRNFGLTVAKGDYITFIDNDDVIHPCFIEILLQSIIETGEPMAMCHYSRIDDNEEVKFQENIERQGIEFLSRNQLYASLFSIPIDKMRKSPVPFEMIWGRLYKRGLIENLYFRDVWGEDAEYNSRLFLKIDRIALVPVSLYFWVQHSDSLHRHFLNDKFTSYLTGSWYMYQNLPLENQYFRSLGAKRLYLSILSTRFLVNSYDKYRPLRDETLDLIKSIIEKSWKEFYNNHYISAGFKTMIYTFYKFPFTYLVFRKITEKLARLR